MAGAHPCCAQLHQPVFAVFAFRRNVSHTSEEADTTPKPMQSHWPAPAMYRMMKRTKAASSPPCEQEEVHVVSSKLFVEQKVYSLAGGKFSFCMLGVDSLLASAHASFRPTLYKSFDLFLLYTHYFILNINCYFSLGFSHISVSTPIVDLGWRNAILRPSAPLRGALSMSLTPFAAASSRQACTFFVANAI